MAAATPAPDRNAAVVVSRRVAVFAGLLVFLALLIGQLAVAGQSAPPTSTKTVSDEGKSETSTTTAPATPGGQQVTTTSKTADPVTTTTTETSHDTSWFGRLLDNPGAWLALSAFAAVLAAFLAGAATQRVYLGEYAIKLGSFIDLPALPTVAATEVPKPPAIVAADLPPATRIDLYSPKRPWWATVGRPTEPPQSLFLYQRVRLQTIVRIAAGARDVIDYDIVVTVLAQRPGIPASFAAAVAQLDELADRVLKGADIDTGVKILLNDAFNKAANSLLGGEG